MLILLFAIILQLYSLDDCLCDTDIVYSVARHTYYSNMRNNIVNMYLEDKTYKCHFKLNNMITPASMQIYDWHSKVLYSVVRDYLLFGIL